MELPPLPERLLAALLPDARADHYGDRESHDPAAAFDDARQHLWDLDDIDVSPSTAEFLSGKHAQANGSWNDKLFKAACDLKANEVPVEDARPLLLKGASPNTSHDEKIAIATIESAYSQLREPSRL